MSNAKFREIQIEDLVQNPNKYGAPTFEQFCRNPNAWRNPADQLLITADRGSSLLKDVKRHRYEVEGVKCKTLHDVERYCLNEGITLDQLEMKPELIQVDAGKKEVIVRFRKKRNVQKPA